MQERVRIITLDPGPEEQADRERRQRAVAAERAARGAWLVPPLILAAVIASWALVQRGPGPLFGYTLAVLFGLGFLWIAVSVLWPARADRLCPACKRERLARLDGRTTRGLVCRACGWRDESLSSWFLAEEEGPLEDIVLRERARRGSGHRAQPMGEER